MYKALKSAQNDINEALLKFADEAMSVNLTTKADTSKCPRGEPCQCAFITQSNVAPIDTEQLKDIQNNIQFLHQKQNAQYEVLVRGVQDLNVSMANVVKLLIHMTKETIVDTATTIPNLAPQAQGSDLKNVCVTVPEPVTAPVELETPRDVDEDNQSAIEADDVTPDIDVEEAEIAQEAEEEAEIAEEEAEIAQEEDEGIEVEEWTYKGRKFFKDSENTVYANNNGEIGDSIGLYDPVKNIVKKLP